MHWRRFRWVHTHGDLQDLAARDGKAAEVDARIRELGAQHARKPSFIARLRKAGLLESGP